MNELEVWGVSPQNSLFKYLNMWHYSITIINCLRDHSRIPESDASEFLENLKEMFP